MSVKMRNTVPVIVVQNPSITDDTESILGNLENETEGSL